MSIKECKKPTACRKKQRTCVNSQVDSEVATHIKPLVTVITPERRLSRMSYQVTTQAALLYEYLD